MLVKIKISREENAKNIPCTLGDILEYDIEDYVKGVVPSELNGPAEAMKAQAVAARSIAYKAALSGSTLSDLSTKTQAFREIRRTSSSYAAAHKAVEDTTGEVLFYDGKIINSCPYSHSNGGRIISSQERWGGTRAWLIGKDDPYDNGPKNGHGVGMSQTGAKKMASLGFTYKDILNFYYPGTVVTKTGEEEKKEEIIMAALEPNAQKVKDWALSKKGCGYTWGATGQTMTTAVMNALKNRYPDHVDTNIVKKWIGKQIFDCASFVRLGMKEAGVSMVSGASSQWKKTDWEATGTIDTIPKDKLCAVYHESPNSNPMSHTGIYLGDGWVMDARGSKSGVIYSKLTDYKWTHWGIPKGLYTGEPVIEEVFEVLYQAKVTATSGSNVRMRKSATTASTVLKNIKLGQIVDVVGEQGDWLKIVYAGETGFMMKKFLVKVENAVTEPDPAPVEPQQPVTKKSWYVKVECENENDAKTIVAILAKLAKAKAVEE